MSSRHPPVAGARRRSSRIARGQGLEVELEHRPLWEVARTLAGSEPGVVFLDGGGPTELGRWSYLGWRPRRVVCWPQGRPGALQQLRVCLDAGGRRSTRRSLPADADRPAGEVPFHGGWIGWVAYDLGRHFERLPERARADASMPDFVLGEYDSVLAEDRIGGRLFVTGRSDGDTGDADLVARAEALLSRARQPGATRTGREPAACGAAPPLPAAAATAFPPGAPALDPEPRPLTDAAEYLRAVARVLEHIRAGDIYQANYSHRFAAATTAPSAAIYERLRAASAAPFGCYLDLPGGPEILSASPELFLRKTGNRLQTRPIKGTRPRAADPAIDARLRAELQDSPKERAELLMITDLLRNDLGRVAEYGSVRVTKLRELHTHPTVHHASSVIEAELRDGLGVADVIAATFPGGSVTGAPKIRAMQILEQLEPLRRGPYTGAAGYFGYDGDVCLNILIRTLVRRGNQVWYQVGGGIVADSDPQAEYRETLAKGAALRGALVGS